MTLTVEDGTGLPNSDSYVSLDACAAYFTARGGDCWSDPQFDDVQREAAIRRATFYIDPKYRDRFPGYQVKGFGQALEWPRMGAYITLPDNGRSDAWLYGVSGQDYYFSQGTYYIPNNVVPTPVVNATCEAAIRELIKPGVLNPDLTRNDLLQKMTAGPVSRQYGAGTPDTTIFQRIDQALSAILIRSNPYSGSVAR